MSRLIPTVRNVVVECDGKKFCSTEYEGNLIYSIRNMRQNVIPTKRNEMGCDSYIMNFACEMGFVQYGICI